MTISTNLQRLDCKQCSQPMYVKYPPKRGLGKICEDCKTCGCGAVKRYCAVRCRSCTDRSRRGRRINRSRRYPSEWYVLRRRLAFYGITVRDYYRLLVAQEFKCGICSKERTDRCGLVVDHDHVTGRVRGLLCSGCNRAIGLIGEKNLEKALEWVHARFR
jgi:hypothetical protein